jgi:DNA adenine methylase
VEKKNRKQDALNHNPQPVVAERVGARVWAVLPHPQPFLKWASGKHKLLPELLSLLPAFPGDYHELFLGGGAPFFGASNSGLLDGKQIFLSDACPELVNAYLVLRDHPEDLIAQLDVLRALPHAAPTYYKIRAQEPSILTDVERAARTIYLNKTCVNGIHRVNLRGTFNVPYGKHKNLSIPGPDLLRADSRALQGAGISCADFRASLQAVRPGDLVYIDPPYDGVKFTQYTPGGFKRNDQEDLATEFERLAQLGAYVMMSNSDTDWVRERYAAFKQVQVMAPRSVNSNGKGRGPVTELIIIGWEPAVVAVVPASVEVVR